MKTRNRGKKSSDDKIFAAKWHPVFKNAVDDFCFLLSRGYTEHSAGQAVGNRYKLNKRQRIAILRMSCSDQQKEIRKLSEYTRQKLKNKPIVIDGFNLLILLESALSGAYLFKGRDGAYRDISSVHGSYKRVIKTEEAILMVGKELIKLKVKSVTWYFDRPVSNSGRLKTLLLEMSRREYFNWKVSLVNSPDKILAVSKAIVVTSDSWILDRVESWFNLGSYLIENRITSAQIISV
jgi:hypothetical protein